MDSGIKINKNSIVMNLMIIRKFFLYTFLMCMVSSCQDNYKFTRLKKERDSLAAILKEINDNKYVFDSVSMKTIISPENILIEDNEYKVDFYFVGYNKNSYFKDYDTIVNGVSMVRDTLKSKKGVFLYKKNLREGKNKIKGLISSNNKYGKEIKGVLYHTLTASKKE